VARFVVVRFFGAAFGVVFAAGFFAGAAFLAVVVRLVAVDFLVVAIIPLPVVIFT
jgi:hypothetical protein